MGRRSAPKDDEQATRVASWLTGTALWTAMFLALAFGTEFLSSWDAARSDPDGGADIGGALLLLAGFGAAGVLAGIWDSWRSLPLRLLMVRWVLVGLLTGIAAAIYRAIDHGQLDLLNVAVHFAFSTVILALDVTGAAAVAGVIMRDLSKYDHRADLS